MQEKSQMSNHLWIPCVLCLVSHGLSLCGQMFALESYFWNRSPGEGVYSVLNRGSRHTGHGARCVTQLWNAEREIQASASIWFLAVWCLLGVLHVPWLLLVHRWHVLPFPVNSLPQEISLYSAHSCSLSPCLDVLLCVTQWVSLFLVCFFF